MRQRWAAIALARAFHPAMYFDIPLSDVSLFTDNQEMRRYLENDPHRLHRATARFLFASAVLDRAIARAKDGSLRVPSTLILAGRERIIDNRLVRDALARLTDGKVRTADLDAAHTIEFEPDPRPYFELLCEAVNPPGVGK